MTGVTDEDVLFSICKASIMIVFIVYSLGLFYISSGEAISIGTTLIESTGSIIIMCIIVITVIVLLFILFKVCVVIILVIVHYIITTHFDHRYVTRKKYSKLKKQLCKMMLLYDGKSETESFYRY